MAPPTASPQTVVVFGTYDESRHPRVTVLREALGAAGLEVVVCNAPIKYSTAARVRMLRQPWRLIPAAVHVLGRWVSLVRQARRIGRRPAAVVVGYLGVVDIHLAKLLFRAPILLDNMAPVGGIARDRALRFAWLLDVVDKAAMSAADVVLVDTEEHLPDSTVNAAIVSVGAPEIWFKARNAPDSSALEAELSVAFFGLFTPLQGAEVIGKAIAQLASEGGVRFTLVGAGQDRSSVEAVIGTNTNVRWVDWLDALELPYEIASHDVCLGIFGSTPKAHRVVPNKVYQGAAAGCVVITSDTPPQRRALADAALFVPPGDDVALAQALRSLRDDPELRISLKRAAAAHAEAHFSPSVLAGAVTSAVDSAGRQLSVLRQEAG